VTATATVPISIRRARSTPRFVQSAAAPLAVVGLIILWAVLVAVLQVPSYLVPGPWAVWEATVANAPALLSHTWVTLWESLAGFILSVVIGVPLAILITSSKSLERIIYPLLVASQAIPKVALAPLLLVWMGYGVGPKIVVAFLIAFFPVVVNTATGLASVPGEMTMLVRSMGASRWTTFRKVRFPSAVPSMMAGFKVAIALAVVGAVVGEFVGSQSGLGYFLLVATGNFDTPLVFACVLVLTVMGVVLFYAMSAVGRLLGRWTRGMDGGETSGSWAS
jgi:NitT/TauT family transport system permease protein